MNSSSHDTSLEADAVYRRAVMSRSPDDRLRMATAMWGTGKRLVESGLRAIGVTDPVELKIQTFLRMYATDFDEATRARIVARLRARA
jgi:hypothetical protein